MAHIEDGDPGFRWVNPPDVPSRSYRCGYCGNQQSSSQGLMSRSQYSDDAADQVRLCSHCGGPTAFRATWGPDQQWPPVLAGKAVEHLPEDVADLYEEARTASTIGAYTAAGLALRKLLMHVAVNLGAKPGKGFIEYVDHLEANNHVPTGSRGWLDAIRQHGNEANHQIVRLDQGDAELLLSFAEQLLRNAYEFPARAAVLEARAAERAAALKPPDGAA